MTALAVDVADWLRPKIEASIKYHRGYCSALLPGARREGNVLYLEHLELAARFEADLAILAAHRPVAVGGWVECGECGPNHSVILESAPDDPGALWPCRTVRLLARGYRYRGGYRREWRP